MKRLLYTVLAAVTVMTTVSCRSQEDKMASEVLSGLRDVMSVARVVPFDTVTYGERTLDSLNYCRMKSSWDSTFLSLYTYEYDEPDRREHYRKEYESDKAMRKRLNERMETMGKRLEMPYTILYALRYFYRDEYGNILPGVFFIEFNDKKEIVRYTCDSYAGWTELRPEYLFR